LWPKPEGLKEQDGSTMTPITAPVGEAFSIVGTCINCTAPASLLATLTVLAIGVALALRAERGKAASPGV
jgi:S-methylmethionine-dependent homocysteine/selenocysteine methylase